MDRGGPDQGREPEEVAPGGCAVPLSQQSLSAVLFAGCQTTPTFNPDDPAVVAAIESRLQAAMDGAAKADTEQVTSGFANDATFITEDVILSGLGDIRSRFADTYSGLTGQHHTVRERRVRILSPDVALVMATGEGTYTDKAGWTSEPVGQPRRSSSYARTASGARSTHTSRSPTDPGGRGFPLKERSMQKHLLATAAVVAVAAAAAAQVAKPPSQPSPTPRPPTLSDIGMFIYPGQGQSPDQLAKDQEACTRWAEALTGLQLQAGSVDTQAAAKAASKEVGNATEGAAAHGVAQGALAGTAIGAIAGNTGKGAAIGAVAGAMGGFSARRQAQAAGRSAGCPNRPRRRISRPSLRSRRRPGCAWRVAAIR